MPTIPYIHFDGHCAEALALYAEVFGGTDLQMMRYADAPGMSDGMKDSTPGMKADAQAGVSIMQGVGSVADGQRIFDRLAECGHVGQAFGPSFFSPGFGMVTDRFGTHWMLSVMPEPAPAA